MRLMTYNDLDTSRVKKEDLKKVLRQLEGGDFKSARVEMLHVRKYLSARINKDDRLLLQAARHGDETILLVLEVIRNHEYRRSRFLRGASVDESKLVPLDSPKDIGEGRVVIRNFNPQRPIFHYLDRPLSLDEPQLELLASPLPAIIAGSAGGGKTVLALEKIKTLSGLVLYITRSSHLASHVEKLFHSEGYAKDGLVVEFKSFDGYLAAVAEVKAKDLEYGEFKRWLADIRKKMLGKTLDGLDTHMLHEEFKGVLTGANEHKPYLEREDYLRLGVKESLFPSDKRDAVYNIFARYLADFGSGDVNIVAHEALEKVQSKYDFVVVDEVQDMTNVQIALALRALKPGNRFQFILCGDAHQIVHPNFFSWSKVKSMFFDSDLPQAASLHSLAANYRNSKEATELANRLLRIKKAAFGSIDRESEYEGECRSNLRGRVELLPDTVEIKRDLNLRTHKSVDVAVLVPRDEDKHSAKAFFKTPLLFSIHEAKGLEYKSVILHNFVSGNPGEFERICGGVTDKDLQDAVGYARGRDKGDKGLEEMKFYINSLYVAITRATGDIYIVERLPQHPMLDLLAPEGVLEGTGAVAQKSSEEDWSAAAADLEARGKKEQAERVRKEILVGDKGVEAAFPSETKEFGAGIHRATNRILTKNATATGKDSPYPWRVMDLEWYEEAKEEALKPGDDKLIKSKLAGFAILNGIPSLLDRIIEANYKKIGQIEKIISEVKKNSLTNKAWSQSKIEKYGVEYRNEANLTPLMVAAELRDCGAIKKLVGKGASINAMSTQGQTPYQLFICPTIVSGSSRHVLLNDWDNHELMEAHNLLCPEKLSVRADGKYLEVGRSDWRLYVVNALAASLKDFGEYLPGCDIEDFLWVLDIPAVREGIPAWEDLDDQDILYDNEMFNPDADFPVFWRIDQTCFLFNPNMEIMVEGEWLNIYDMMGFKWRFGEPSDEFAMDILAMIDNPMPYVKLKRSGKFAEFVELHPLPEKLDIGKQEFFYTLKRAREGDADSQHSLGFFYESGSFVEIDYKKAVKWYQKSADGGSGAGQLSLASLYMSGMGVGKDYAKAFEWFQKSADQGVSEAIYFLGILYRNRLGVEEDKGKAMELFGKAVDMGHADAQFLLGELLLERGQAAEAAALFVNRSERGCAFSSGELGLCYLKGEGVPQNTEKGESLLKRGFENGYSLAALHLGEAFYNGTGVKRDFNEAVKWLKIAARDENPKAKYLLGCCRLNGEGLEKNEEKGVKWLEQAAAQGHADAQQLLAQRLILHSHPRQADSGRF